MPRNPAAFEAGATEAKREIAAGRLRLFSGAPSQAAWGHDLAETLRTRFGIEVTFTSCLVTEESVSFEEGYNSAVEAHINGIWGQGALEAVHGEVQQRRKQRYDALITAQNPAEPRAALDRGGM